MTAGKNSGGWHAGRASIVLWYVAAVSTIGLATRLLEVAGVM